MVVFFFNFLIWVVGRVDLGGVGWRGFGFELVSIGFGLAAASLLSPERAEAGVVVVFVGVGGRLLEAAATAADGGPVGGLVELSGGGLIGAIV